MKTVVASVVFMEALDYLPVFLDSLKTQTDLCFDIILVNDNIPIEKLSDIVQKVMDAFGRKIVIVDKRQLEMTPGELRVEMIKHAYKMEYDLLIMQDCDDIGAKNRVECIHKQFDSNYGFFYNELRDFKGKKVMSTLPSYTLDFKKIGEYNYLGMSNGIINLKHLTWDFIESLKNGKTPVFDWYLYSRMLLAGEKGKKIEGGVTYYRIYESNLAGRCAYSQEAIDKEIEVKKKHYALLKEYEEYYNNLANLYENDLIEQVNTKGSRYWWSLTRGHVC